MSALRVALVMLFSPRRFEAALRCYCGFPLEPMTGDEIEAVADRLFLPDEPAARARFAEQMGFYSPIEQRSYILWLDVWRGAITTRQYGRALRALERHRGAET